MKKFMLCITSGRGGGQGVSMLSFYSDDPSSNAAKFKLQVFILYNCLKNDKDAGKDHC